MAKRLGETSYKETAFSIIPRSKLIPLEIDEMANELSSKK